ncbi:MAG TPA: nucleotidyltransferase family protein [Polyangiaceae bacterium]
MALFNDLAKSGWGEVILGRRGGQTRFSFSADRSAADLDRAMARVGIKSRSSAQNSSRSNAEVADREELPAPTGGLRRADVVDLLEAHREAIHRLGVRTLSLFGSVARDEARPGSDVDLLAVFDGPITSDKFFGTKFFLEDLLGARVDLATEGSVRERFRGVIEPELIRVA